MITTPRLLTVAHAIALLAPPSQHGVTVVRPPLIDGVP